MRASKVISLSLPPEMENKVQKLAKEERRSISEIMREALRHYMTNRDMASIRAEGKKIAKRKKLKPKDVERIVMEGRHYKSIQRGLKQASRKKFAKDPRSPKDAKMVNDIED